VIAFEDLSPDDRIVLGPTGATREEVMAFARAYDPQSFHLSDEAASQTYFGRLSASGWHTVAMTLALVSDNADWPLACRGCYEIRDLRWRAPVYPDDRLMATVTISACGVPRDEATGRVDLRVEMTNQDGVTAAEMTLGLAVARRAAAS
jgi:acyl dehydratase